MPYFFASSVDSTISSTVIFLSMRVEDLLRARLDAEAQALAAGEAHLAEQLVAEHVDARVAAPEEAEAARADAAAQLEDALLVRGEGVVLDLDHLHRQARDGPLQRVEDVGHRLARKPRPQLVSAPQKVQARGSRGRSSRCACRRSRAGRRGCRGRRWPRGPGRARRRRPRGRPCPRCRPWAARAARRSIELEEGGLALAERDRVDLGVVREHLRGERRGVRPAHDDVRAGVQAADGAARRARRRGGSPSSRTCRRGRRRARRRPPPRAPRRRPRGSSP